MDDSKVSVCEGTQSDLSGTFASREQAYTAIRERMDREGFYPNVWVISDHGNAVLVDVSAE